MYGFDAETEALRRELGQLPQQDLLALAQQEGVRVAGLRGADIIEALLRMGNDDAAATAQRQAPGQLAHQKDQPPSRSHARRQSGSASKQQQYSAAEYTHDDAAGSAHISKQHQQLNYQRQQQQQQGNLSGSLQAAAAARIQHPAAHMQQHPLYHQQQQAVMAQAQQARMQRPRQRRSNDSDQEIPHDSTFQKSNAGVHAARPRATPAQAAAVGDDSRGVPFGDQAAVASSNRLQQGTPDARTRVQSASVPRSDSSGGGRAGAKPGQTTPRDILKQQQHLELATKMQELELTLQNMPQRSPRTTFVHPDALSAQTSYYAAKSSAGGSAAGSSGGGSGPSSATKTNRRLWASPPVPAPLGHDGLHSKGKPSPANRVVSSSGSSSRPAGHSSGKSLEAAFIGASRPRSAGLAAAAAAGASASPGRPMSSGGGSRTSNIFAEHASLKSPTSGLAPCPGLSPQQQQASTTKQEHARALTLSPAPAKGTPRVGVMPCQKALLKKAAQEAAKAEAAAAEAVAAAAASKSALRASGLQDRPSSSKSSSGGGRGSVSSHGAATPLKVTGGGSSSSAVVGRSAGSSSGALQRSGGGVRAGTPEPPARRNTASSATAAGIQPMPPTLWPQKGVAPSPMPSPKLPVGCSTASASGALLGNTTTLEERQLRSSRGRAAVAQASGCAGLGSKVEAAGRPEVPAGRSLSVNGQGRAQRSGAVTPPPRGMSARAASARGTGHSSVNGSRPGSSSSSGYPQQQQGQRELLSMSGTGLAGRARQLLAGSPVLGRHAREEVAGNCADTMRSQQKAAAAAKQMQVLHTPVRVRAAPTVSTASNAANRAYSIQDSKPAITGYSSPVAAKTRSIAAAAFAAVSAAATPARQVRAFGEGVSAAYNDPSSSRTARKAPLAGTAAAAAAAAATDGPAVLIGGVMTPKAAAMGSARRIAPTRSRTGMAAAATGVSDTAAVADRGGSNDGSSAAGLVTPLHKGARRMVPSDGGVDEVDKHLQALVDRCLRIRNPEAHKLALQGPEPAKRWLQQHVVSSWKRAGGTSSSSGGGSGGGACAAAGYCSRSLLLHGPTGCGKTELVHALASDMGANLLYVPGGDSLLKTYQQEGHRLLRAMFAVARRVAPCVLCFDDAHITFPSSASCMSDPGGTAAAARMVVELEVQLQQLADMQASLEASAAQPPHSAIKASATSSSMGGSGTPARRGHGDSGGGSDGFALKPVWGFFSSKVKGKQQQQLLVSDGGADARQQQQQQQQPGYKKMGGPVVVVFVTQALEAMDGAVLQQLPVHLALAQPSGEAREELLMGWLMEREAALNVQDLEWLARQTQGFSCSELVQLCQLAARRAAQERPPRAISMDDLEAALHAMLPSPTKQQQQASPQRALQLRHNHQQRQQTPHRTPGAKQQQR